MLFKIQKTICAIRVEYFRIKISPRDFPATKFPISLHDVENLAIVILTASVQQYTVPPHHIWTRVTIFLNFLVQNFSPKDFPPCNKISRFPLDAVNPAMIIF